MGAYNLADSASEWREVGAQVKNNRDKQTSVIFILEPASCPIPREWVLVAVTHFDPPGM